MEISEVKAWLNRGRDIQKELLSLEAQRIETANRATSITPNYSGVSVSGSRDPHSIENRLETMERLNALMAERIATLADVSGDVFRVIRQVSDNKERAVLIDRYLNFFTWEQVAASVQCTPTNANRIHRRALESVKSILDCMEPPPTVDENCTKTVL